MKELINEWLESIKPKSPDKQNLVHNRRYRCKVDGDTFYAWFDEYDDVFYRENGSCLGNIEWEYWSNSDMTRGQLQFESMMVKHSVKVNLDKNPDLRYKDFNAQRLYSMYRDLMNLGDDLDYIFTSELSGIYGDGKYKGD